MIFFSMSLGHHFLWREGKLKDFDTDTKDEIGEKFGVDVADNEDAWDTLLLEGSDDYRLEFEIKLNNN